MHLLFIGSSNKICLGDLGSGRAFDNGCTCFDTCQGVVNDLRGKRTDCTCNVSLHSSCSSCNRCSTYVEQCTYLVSLLLVLLFCLTLCGCSCRGQICVHVFIEVMLFFLFDLFDYLNFLVCMFMCIFMFFIMIIYIQFLVAHAPQFVN